MCGAPGYRAGRSIRSGNRLNRTNPTWPVKRNIAELTHGQLGIVPMSPSPQTA